MVATFQQPDRSRLVAGLIVIVAGLVLLLVNLGAIATVIALVDIAVGCVFIAQSFGWMFTRRSRL